MARNFQLRVASNLRSIEGKVSAMSKYTRDMPRHILLDVSDFAYNRAQLYSEGTITKQQLRGYRPGKYSTKRAPQKGDYMVNRHEGRFHAGWRRRPVRRIGDRWEVAVFNVWMPIARYLLEGTRRMRKRPLLEKVGEQAKTEMRQVVQREARKLRDKWRKGALPKGGEMYGAGMR